MPELRYVAVVGADPRDKAFIRSTLELYLTGEGWRFSDDHSVADVLFVDTDNAPLGLQQSAATDHRRLVALTNGAGSQSAAQLCLCKPLRYRTLLDVFRRLTEPDGAQDGGGHFDPAETLLASIERAAKNSVDLMLQAPGGEVLLLSGLSRQYRVSAPASSIDALSAMPLPSFSVIREGRLQQIPTSVGLREPRPLRELAFRVALRASAGRFWTGTEPGRVFRLIRWPGFTELPHEPIHMRLAALLSQRPSTIAEAAHFVGAPIEAVVDFHNACRAIGIVAYPPSVGEVGNTFASDSDDESVYANIRLRLKSFFGR